MSVGELAMTRRISLVAACCSNASSRSRLSCLFSRRSLTPSVSRDERCFLDGGRLVVGILYLSLTYHYRDAEFERGNIHFLFSVFSAPPPVKTTIFSNKPLSRIRVSNFPPILTLYFLR